MTDNLILLLFASMMLVASCACGGDVVKPLKLPLWSDGIPGGINSPKAIFPEMIVYLPAGQKDACPAVLICPGGGYGGLCDSYEGHDIAKWLNGYGIAGIVLRYRLSPYRHPVPLNDAQRAMRMVRMNAKEWNLNPTRIGVMGFSAGGHLASTLGTHFDAGNPKAKDEVDQNGCRPDFMILVYPVITMGPKSHGGSRKNLLGAKPTEEDIKLLSNELQVTKETPPTFITHSITDHTVPVDNSRMFYKALKDNGVAATYHELKSGKHGLGCGKGKEWKEWQKACDKWLKRTLKVSAEYGKENKSGQ